jgi:hypothetical protein
MGPHRESRLTIGLRRRAMRTGIVIRIGDRGQLVRRAGPDVAPAVALDVRRIASVGAGHDVWLYRSASRAAGCGRGLRDEVGRDGRWRDDGDEQGATRHIGCLPRRRVAPQSAMPSRIERGRMLGVMRSDDGPFRLVSRAGCRAPGSAPSDVAGSVGLDGTFRLFGIGAKLRDSAERRLGAALAVRRIGNWNITAAREAVMAVLMLTLVNLAITHLDLL